MPDVTDETSAEGKWSILRRLSGITENPISWIEQYVNLGLDLTSPCNCHVDFKYNPYIKPVIEAIFELKRLQISVCAPSQTTKTSVLLFSLLYILANKATTSLVVYQSDKIASEINDKLVNLMQGIPKLRRELEAPFSQTAEAFKFSDSISNFQGAGAPISTRPAEYVFLDEINLWGTNAGGNSNVLQAMKRGTQYPHSKVVSVCTPTDEGEESQYKIYGMWKSGSQEAWHLRCQRCHKLSMDSRVTHNLQWELDENNRPVPESIVLICPACGHWHKEADRFKLIEEGGYIPGDPSMLNRHRTFTWGALASKAPAHTWPLIADAQLNAGRTASLDAQQDFDNNFRGLPLQYRKNIEADNESWEKLKEELPKKEDIIALFLSADSQDAVYKWAVIGLDRQWTLHVIEAGTAADIPALNAIYRKTFIGGMPLKAAILDTKGHRFVESRAYAKDTPGIWLYSGTGFGTGTGKQKCKWQLDLSNTKTIKAAARLYQRDLLWRIHVNQNAMTHSIRFYKGILPDCIEECANVKPNKHVRNGGEFPLWEASGKDRRDYFDCLKMVLPLLDVLRKKYPHMLPLPVAPKKQPKTIEGVEAKEANTIKSAETSIPNKPIVVTPAAAKTPPSPQPRRRAPLVPLSL